MSLEIRKTINELFRKVPSSDQEIPTDAHESVGYVTGSSVGFKMESREMPGDEIIELIDGGLVDGLPFFTTLQHAIYRFAQACPQIVVQFQETLKYRSENRGFPEFALGKEATSAALEAVLLARPSRDSIECAIGILGAQGTVPAEIDRVAEIDEYLEQALVVLVQRSLKSERFMTRVFKNIQKTAKSERVEVYICALHIDYITNRDQVPC